MHRNTHEGNTGSTELAQPGPRGERSAGLSPSPSPQPRLAFSVWKRQEGQARGRALAPKWENWGLLTEVGFVNLVSG